MTITINSPGLQTTVQDLGRPGFYDGGIPPSGALDQRSARLANALVGNDETAALLEATFTGPAFTVDSPTVMAVTGAPMEVKVNGESIQPWSAVALREGSLVEASFATSGARSYFAFSGGISVPPVMGSRSTYVYGRIGGHLGRALVAEDQLEILASNETSEGRRLPAAEIPRIGGPTELRVVLGPFDHLFEPESVRAFFDTEWELTRAADRTGFRFSGGPELRYRQREQPFGAGSDPSNIVDAGYPIGTIQVPGGRDVIALHRDAVTGGGYAMIATVISTDLDTLGQVAPGVRVRFIEVSLADAVAARGVARNEMAHLRDLITR